VTSETSTTPVASADTGGAGLQFDTADVGAAGASLRCAGCRQPIAGEYFDVNGQIFCPACKADLERMFGATPEPSALARAIVYGMGGGVAGALLYYVVWTISGIYLGLLAIAVGWLVGQGVRLGNGSRGGPRYQAIAVVITYLAVAASFVPVVDARPPVETAFLALTAPFRLLAEGRLTIVAVAIGLVEAWRLNTRVRLTVTGPLHAGFGRPAALPSGATTPGARSA